MFGLSRLLLLASLTTAALFPRDYPSVQSNLFKLYVSADNVTSTAEKYNGTAPTFITAYVSQNYLLRNFSSTTGNITSSAVFTPVQAGNLLRNVTTILYPKIKAALDAIVGKKGNYTTQGLVVIERSFLSTLSTSVSSFGTAIVVKVPAAQTASAKAVSTSLASLLASAQSAFG